MTGRLGQAIPMTPDECPNCGADLPAKARACPECGACPDTGWADEALIDTIAGHMDVPWHVIEEIRETVAVHAG